MNTDNIDAELTAKGLRRAAETEPGWNVEINGSPVWATDARAQKPVPADGRKRQRQPRDKGQRLAQAMIGFKRDALERVRAAARSRGVSVSAFVSRAAEEAAEGTKGNPSV